MTKGLVIAAVVLAGCHKDSTVATSAATTKANDTLWAFAPDGAKFGVVVSPHAVEMIENAWLDIRAFIQAAPDLEEVARLLDRTTERELGTKAPRLADLGLSNQRGGAMFVIDEDAAVAIVPVVDRDKFRKQLHGSLRGDVDVFGKMSCKPVQDVYACATSAAMFDRIGKGNLRARFDAANLRGDIELAGTVPQSHAVVVQLSRGAITVRGEVSGLPAPLVAMMKPTTAPRADPGHTSGFAVIPVASLAAAVPEIPLKGGITVKDIMSAFSGAITLSVPAGETAIDLRAPLAKPDMIKSFVENCTMIGPLGSIGAKAANGTCHIPLPDTQLSVDAWIEDSTLRIATSKDMPAGKAIPMSEVGTEIAKQSWMLAFWGHGALVHTPAVVPAGFSMPREAKYAIRAMTMLSEMGVGVRVVDDKVVFVGTLRTAWSNPDDVVAKLAAIDPGDMLFGKATPALEAIAKSSPSSPFASDVESGFGGMIGEMSVMGVLAAVAVPAFMDYMKKPKRSEAMVVLEQIRNSLVDYQINHGSFPAGDVAPGESCCLSATGKCQTSWAAGAWTALALQAPPTTMFRYGYHSDGKVAEAIAVGDLDCDGIEVTYRVKVDASSGTPVPSPIERPTNQD